MLWLGTSSFGVILWNIAIKHYKKKAHSFKKIILVSSDRNIENRYYNPKISQFVSSYNRYLTEVDLTCLLVLSYISVSLT